MSVVAAFLVPGSPLPWLARSNPPWGQIAAAMERAGQMLRAAKPDVVLVYSTQWIAVLDQLWQTRTRLRGVHVDPNWHEYGEIDFDLRVDRDFAEACRAATDAAGIKSRAVDYDQFPIDSGTLVAARLMDPEGRAVFAMTSNNLYHDTPTTARIAELAAGVAAERGQRLAVVGIGGLSGSCFRSEIAAKEDRIYSEDDDRWNREVLSLLESGQIEALRGVWDDYAEQARVDMGFKHAAFVLGALGGQYARAEVLAYGPLYGSGAAVIAFHGGGHPSEPGS